MQNIRKYRLPILFSWLLLIGNTFLFPLYPAGDFDPLNSMTELVLENMVGLEDCTPGDEHKDEGADPLKSGLKYFTVISQTGSTIFIQPQQPNRIIPNLPIRYSAPTFDLNAPPPDRLI
jgi:hypothetical protein